MIFTRSVRPGSKDGTKSLPGLLYPKPRKSERPNERRRREIKRKDKELSRNTETNRCEGCGRWFERTDPAHVVPRRFMKLRHEPSNVKRKCRKCHDAEKPDKKKLREMIREAYAKSAQDSPTAGTKE